MLYELRAKLYVQLEEPEKAMVDYTTAIKTDGTDPDFYIGRGQLYYEQKMYDKELLEYLVLLKFDETNAVANALLARNYIVLSKF